jgi:Protein of unknown function (DUF669)
MAKGSGSITVTFPDDSEGKRADRVPEGEYGFKVLKATKGESSQKKTPQVSFYVQVIKDPTHTGKYKGKKLYDNCFLTDEALWRLRNRLEAMGIPVKSRKAMKLDLAETIGKKFGGTVEDEEYENKIKSRIQDAYPYDEVEDRAAGTAEELDEDEGEEDLDEEDEDEEDEDEDEEEDVDEDEEEDEEEEEDEDEDEEEPEPVKIKKGKVKVKKGSKKRLEEIDLDNI